MMMPLYIYTCLVDSYKKEMVLIKKKKKKRENTKHENEQFNKVNNFSIRYIYIYIYKGCMHHLSYYIILDYSYLPNRIGLKTR